MLIDEFRRHIATLNTRDLDALLGPRSEPALGENLLEAARNGRLFEALDNGEAKPFFDAVESLLGTRNLLGISSKFACYREDFEWILGRLNGKNRRRHRQKVRQVRRTTESRRAELIAYTEKAVGFRDNPGVGCAVANMSQPTAEFAGIQLDRFGEFLLEFAFFVGRLSERINEASKGPWSRLRSDKMRRVSAAVKRWRAADPGNRRIKPKATAVWDCLPEENRPNIETFKRWWTQWRRTHKRLSQKTTVAKP
jgi:hypothetical protein